MSRLRRRHHPRARRKLLSYDSAGEHHQEGETYLRTAQVAELLEVSPKTVSRWAKEGKLPFLKTLGGHRRYPASKIQGLLYELRQEVTAGQPVPPEEVPPTF
jgi:excisionase family DNA binding protein